MTETLRPRCYLALRDSARAAVPRLCSLDCGPDDTACPDPGKWVWVAALPAAPAVPEVGFKSFQIGDAQSPPGVANFLLTHSQRWDTHREPLCLPVPCSLGCLAFSPLPPPPKPRSCSMADACKPADVSCRNCAKSVRECLQNIKLGWQAPVARICPLNSFSSWHLLVPMPLPQAAAPALAPEPL